VVAAVRTVWPERFPLLVRLSATDWVEGGWDLEQSVMLAPQLQKLDVDLIDCSSGGAVPEAKIPVEPSYQVPFAERIRREAGIRTAAVGMITTSKQADQIIRTGQADMVLFARELLREPYWPHRAALALNQNLSVAVQYRRGISVGAAFGRPRFSAWIARFVTRCLTSSYAVIILASSDGALDPPFK
jgi:2,4-dienoyl-CoA reductase-like NADH-dependent reductase (Old Yellow Enzyme family)